MRQFATCSALFCLTLLTSQPTAARLKIPSCSSENDVTCNGNKEDAVKYLDSLDNQFVAISYASSLASWAYSTNITDENSAASDAKSLEFQKFTKSVSAKLKRYDWKSFNDSELTRLAKAYYVEGADIPDETLDESNKLSSKLKTAYATAKVCQYEAGRSDDDDNDGEESSCQKKLSLDPDLTDVFRNSRDHEELKYYWAGWRSQTGNVMKETFFQYFKLSDLAAKSIGYENRQDEWLDAYEVDDFPSLVKNAWTKKYAIGGEQISLENFYKQLHAFVRAKLIKVYNPQGANIQPDGPIPAHLLGNMWAQQWANLEDLLLPFPEAEPMNITQSLIEQNFDARRIFDMSESFFVTLGFEEMTPLFWNLSMLVKPDDGREVVCHASAWDFLVKDDYRVKMCTTINQEDFVTVHHEMGHIAYDMQYRRNPYPYRNAPNPGFHEAIGDTIALSVKTPSHLQSVGLLEKEAESDDSDIFFQLDDGSRYKKNELNFLMGVALEKIAFLPFAMAIDTWRWNYFNGKTQPTKLNEDWWRLRRELQGLEPPVERSEADNLDPLAKYHVAADVPYIRYFFSFISQFQFYEALCKKAGEYRDDNDSSKPLYLCDYSVGGHQTGALLRDMMSKGASQHWELAMQQVTGKPELSGESMIKYFLPIYKYLKQENENAQINPGWTM